MDRKLIRSKLAEIISDLDEIILSQDERACGISSLKECREDMQRVLRKLNARRTVDSGAIVSVIFQFLECLYAWLTKSR